MKPQTHQKVILHCYNFSYHLCWPLGFEDFSEGCDGGLAALQPAWAGTTFSRTVAARAKRGRYALFLRASGFVLERKAGFLVISNNYKFLGILSIVMTRTYEKPLRNTWISRSSSKIIIVQGLARNAYSYWESRRVIKNICVDWKLVALKHYLQFQIVCFVSFEKMFGFGNIEITVMRSVP